MSRWPVVGQLERTGNGFDRMNGDRMHRMVNRMKYLRMHPGGPSSCVHPVHPVAVHPVKAVAGALELAHYPLASPATAAYVLRDALEPAVRTVPPSPQAQ